MEQTESVRFRIQITAKDLWMFSMYHSNKGYLGVFNLFFTLASLWLLVTRWSDVTVAYRILLLICVLMFTVWQPALLYMKAAKQAKTKAVKEPMDMTCSAEGILIEQAEQSQQITWDQIVKVEQVKGLLIIYMGRVHAYLIPEQASAACKEQLLEMIRTNLPAERRKKI